MAGLAPIGLAPIGLPSARRTPAQFAESMKQGLVATQFDELKRNNPQAAIAIGESLFGAPPSPERPTQLPEQGASPTPYNPVNFGRGIAENQSQAVQDAEFQRKDQFLTEQIAMQRAADNRFGGGTTLLQSATGGGGAGAAKLQGDVIRKRGEFEAAMASGNKDRAIPLGIALKGLEQQLAASGGGGLPVGGAQPRPARPSEYARAVTVQGPSGGQTMLTNRGSDMYPQEPGGEAPAQMSNTAATNIRRDPGLVDSPGAADFLAGQADTRAQAIRNDPGLQVPMEDNPVPTEREIEAGMAAQQAAAGSGIPTKGGTGGIGLGDEAIDLYARRSILMGGSTEQMGLGVQIRGPVMSRVAQIVAEEGITPEQLLENGVRYKANAASYANLMKGGDQVSAFSRTTDLNLALALELSGRLDDTGVPVANRALRKLQGKYAGDADVAAYEAAIRTAINEYAKAVTTVTGGGVTSDSARKEMEGILNTSMTQGQIESVIPILQQEMRNRLKSYGQQGDAIFSRMHGKPDANVLDTPQQSKDAGTTSPADEAEAYLRSRGL